MSIGERLRHLRKDVLKINQEDVAGRLKVTRSYISNLEKGDRAFTDRTIADICREYKVKEEWLRNGTGDMFQVESDDLDYLVAKYGSRLTDAQRKLIIAILKMDDRERAAVDNFIDSLLGIKDN